MSFTICYVLVDNGVDVADLLSKVGIEASDKAETAGTVAIAYAAHKAASPIRFPPTVALTPLTAKVCNFSAPTDPRTPEQHSKSVLCRDCASYPTAYLAEWQRERTKQPWKDQGPHRRLTLRAHTGCMCSICSIRRRVRRTKAKASDHPTWWSGLVVSRR